MEFLIADLEHFGESLWRNEEVGEKRFNFFITLITAVLAGLVALHVEGKEKLGLCELKSITNVALMTLLVLGIMTYLRMLHRNRDSDQYQRTLKHIREKLLAINPMIEEYRVPQPLVPGTWKHFRGGLAETVGATVATLVCSLLLFNSVPIVWAAAAGLLVLLVSFLIAAPRKGLS